HQCLQRLLLLLLRGKVPVRVAFAGGERKERREQREAGGRFSYSGADPAAGLGLRPCAVGGGHWRFSPDPAGNTEPNRGGGDRCDGAKSMTGFIPAPIKPEITMDHLEKVDIRAGLIERVELVPTSGKLVRLTVDFGDRRRTVLAGLRGERADPKAEIEG